MNKEDFPMDYAVMRAFFTGLKKAYDRVEVEYDLNGQPIDVDADGFVAATFADIAAVFGWSDERIVKFAERLRETVTLDMALKRMERAGGDRL